MPSWKKLDVPVESLPSVLSMARLCGSVRCDHEREQGDHCRIERIRPDIDYAMAVQIRGVRLAATPTQPRRSRFKANASGANFSLGETVR